MFQIILVRFFNLKIFLILVKKFCTCIIYDSINKDIQIFDELIKKH